MQKFKILIILSDVQFLTTAISTPPGTCCALHKNTRDVPELCMYWIKTDCFYDVQCIQKVTVHLQTVLEVMSMSIYTGLNHLIVYICIHSLQICLRNVSYECSHCSFNSLTLSARHPFQNFSTPCILNVNNTGAKQRSIMK
jgi:hypothetical protein